MELKKALVQVNEVLKHLNNEEYKKIPDKIILAIEENKDKFYLWKYDCSKELVEQDLSRDAIALLSYINMKYLLNQEQKDFMYKLHYFNEQKSELEKRKKYSTDNLFKKV